MNITLDRASYIFDPSSQTIEFLGDAFDISRLKLITNVTANEIIYNFADAAAGNGGVSGNLLSLVYDTTAMNPTDVLQVVIDVDEDAANFAAPIRATDPAGNPRYLAVNESGHAIVADGRVLQGSRGASIGPVVQFETTGYGSIVLQMQGTWAGTVSFQASNDGTTWVAVFGWATSSAAAPVSSTTGNGQWVIPCAGRLFRAQFTTATSGFPIAVATLKAFSSWMPLSSPSIAANSTVNVTQIAGATLVAEDSAASTIPFMVGGIVRTALPASTIVASDAIRATFSQSGQLVTKQNAPGDLDFYVAATATGNTQTAIRAAQGAGVRQNVTSIVFQNTAATASTFTLQDGSTTLFSISVPVSMTLPQQLVFPTPLRGTANTALNYINGTTGANILFTVTGFNSY